MGNIFIFQIRRVGDFFQSIPLIESLYSRLNDKKKNKIDILTDKTVSGIYDIFNGGINLLTYEYFFKSFFEYSNHSLSSLSASELIGFISGFNPFLSKSLENYDLAVNLNYDISNALLMNFFENRKEGPIAYNKSAKDNESISMNGASNYLFNTVRNRNLNKINIVDIFSLIGIKKPAEIKLRYDILKLKSRKKFRRQNDDKNCLRICISIGATSIKRIWSSDNYAELIALTGSSFNCEFTIVGTAEEADAAMEIKRKLSSDVNIIDLTGKTTINELIYFMKDFDLIISSDTGTLHIAQIFNIPSVSIYTGNANFYETGPHIKNSLVIYSKTHCYPCFEHEPCRFNYACKNDVKPEDVFNLMLLQLKINKTDCRNISRAEYLKTVKNNIRKNIKKGNFSAASCKHLNSIHFYPLVKNEIGKSDLASEILKFSWISVLSEGRIQIDCDKILRYTKKYYKINKITLKSLISEISFVKTVFENGMHSFGRDNFREQAYFEIFEKSVKSIGNNYDYLKLACDYFIRELNSSGALKSFKDIILLLNNAIKILDIA